MQELLLLSRVIVFTCQIRCFYVERGECLKLKVLIGNFGLVSVGTVETLG